jgi:hypothetical protein
MPLAIGIQKSAGSWEYNNFDEIQLLNAGGSYPERPFPDDTELVRRHA